MIGQTLGHYRILDKLGAGGMGEVYVAEDLELERRVALKVLNREMAGSQERIERFRREAKALASLDHPNIVTIFSVDEYNGVNFLIMELLRGRTLTELIPKHGVTLEDFFRIAIPLSDALAAAHEKGVIHRDLKPANVFITEAKTVKVLDFGLAKIRPRQTRPADTEAPTEPLTGEGRVLGTVPYMSPEQLNGEPLDQRSDIFSLGIILYQLATGNRPFTGRTPAEVQSSILRDRPLPVDHHKREMPRHLGRIIDSCLEKDPEHRWQTAKDLRNQLESLQQEVSTGEMQARPRGETRQAWLTRAGWLVAVLLMVIALAAGVTWLRRQHDPEPVQVSEQARALLDQGHLFELRGASKENLAQAEDRYRRALQLEPENPAIQARLAAALADQQRIDPDADRPAEIRRLAESALAEDPDNVAAWTALGHLALVEDDLSAAEKAALEAIEAGPQVYSGYTLYGQVLIALDRVDEGLVQLRQGVALAGSDIRARLALAFRLWKLGRLNAAAAEYETVLRYAPDSPSALINLGVIYGQQGRFLDAIPLFRRRLQSSDDADAAMNLANCYFYLDRLNEAIEAYSQVLEIEPDHPWAKHGMAETFEKLGEPPQARLWFERATRDYDRLLEAGGHRPSLLGLRAVCEAKLGDLAEAITTLAEAERLAPDSAQTLFNAAQVHALAGDREEALRYTGLAIRSGYPRQEFERDLSFRRYSDDPDFRALLETAVVP